MRIPLGKWRPDIPPYELAPGELTRAEGLLPYDMGYMPFLDKTVYSSAAVNSTCLGSAEFKSINGLHYGFIGTATKLWRMNPDKSMTDVTRASGGAYSNGENTWSLSQFGDWYIATNFVDVPQILKGATTANFAALAGAPPKAKYALLNRGHVILANLNEGGTLSPKKVKWARLEDPEDWTETSYDGPDSQDIADADGDITGIGRVGDNFAIFNENSISLWTFANYAPYAFVISGKVSGIGCLAHGSIVSVGTGCFFMAKDNIYYTDGGMPKPLGSDMKNTIMNGINSNYYYRITSAVDPKQGIIMWSYPSINSLDGTPDKVLAYNWNTDRFTLTDMDMDGLISFHSGATTFESLAALYPNVEDLPYQLDSNFYRGGIPQIGCVDNVTHYVNIHAGAAMQGVIETGEITSGMLSDKIPSNQIMLIERVRPGVSMATDPVTVRAGHRMTEADTLAYSASSTVQGDGYAYMRSSGRLLRVEITTGRHNGLTAVEADLVPIAKR